jgi:uncharacterized protein YccT (UPF0319 family)
MISLDQNDRRDFVVVGGRIQTVSDLDSAKVIIDNVIRSQIGEYRYNVTKGIEYENNVFSSAPNLQQFEAQARREVLALPFVERVTKFEYNTNNGTLNYSMTVLTSFGEINVNEL